MKEEDRIKKHYAERKGQNIDAYFDQFETYNRFKREERDQVISIYVKEHFQSLDGLRVLEIGAGKGGNLDLFLNLGFDRSNIYANDLLEENKGHLQKFMPVENIRLCNAVDLDFNHKFDLVFLSLVFTSIIDDEMRKDLARKVYELCDTGGLIVWYDFAFDNPSNKEVRGIGRSELRKLFSSADHIEFHKVTLAPPIGRRVGELYPLFNSLSFLRSHLIAVIKKS